MPSIRNLIRRPNAESAGETAASDPAASEVRGVASAVTAATIGLAAADLTDTETADALRAAVRDRPFEDKVAERFERLSNTAVAALTLLGLTPEPLRPGALALMPFADRAELHTYKFAQCTTAHRIVWGLTPTGDELAQVLATAAPPLTGSQEQDLRAYLAQRESALRAELSED